MGALVVQIGGQARVFTEAFTVGRPGSGCDLVVEDEYASTRHAQFSPAGAGWVVEDMGSTNGTYLNGSFQRSYGPQRLARGDQVRVGRTVLILVPAVG